LPASVPPSKFDSIPDGTLSSRERPIGVFDSGVGGLTVLKELHRKLPNESYIYFGDTHRVPYGTRSPQEIVTFARETLVWLEQMNVKMAIVACNTSSALALDIVRSEFPFPILGVILPGARAAVKAGRRIGIIATPATAKSRAYERAIAEIDPTASVWSVGCPEFVPLIEQNRIHDPYTEGVASGYLQPLLDLEIDTLVYGCTHYPHLAPVLAKILPPHIQLINPADSIVKAAASELQIMSLTTKSKQGKTKFCVSGCPQQFLTRARQWIPEIQEVSRIELPEIETIYNKADSFTEDVVPTGL
jgi:glutamate racemase